jgi:hypothetical protein
MPRACGRGAAPARRGGVQAARGTKGLGVVRALWVGRRGGRTASDARVRGGAAPPGDTTRAGARPGGAAAESAGGSAGRRRGGRLRTSRELSAGRVRGRGARRRPGGLAPRQRTRAAAHAPRPQPAGLLVKGARGALAAAPVVRGGLLWRWQTMALPYSGTGWSGGGGGARQGRRAVRLRARLGLRVRAAPGRAGVRKSARPRGGAGGGAAGWMGVWGRPLGPLSALLFSLLSLRKTAGPRPALPGRARAGPGARARARPRRATQ